jgi:hypothetical protein
MLKEYYNEETKTLTLPFSFNKELKDLPLDTQIIIFEEDYKKEQYSEFNQQVNNLLCAPALGGCSGCPNNLTKIIFGWYFNQNVDATCKNKIFTGAPKNDSIFDGDNLHGSHKCLPNTLTHLTFGQNFNQSVDYLPNNLTHLIFGWNFNQSVNSLPNNLTHLTFGCWFDQSVNNLSNNLTHLTLGDEFNQSVNNLPNSIKELTLGGEFNQSVNNLPNSLTHLTFGYEFNQLVDSLPNTLTHLTFGDGFNQSVNIKRLFMGCKFNQLVNNLPNTLTHLTLGYEFNQSVEFLPNSIKELTYWSKSKLNNIPNSIEYINIIFGNNDKYNEVIENLPFNLKEIRINKPQKAHYLNKIPFGCKVVDWSENEIFL